MRKKNQSKTQSKGKTSARATSSKTSKRPASSERPAQEMRAPKVGETLTHTFGANVTGSAKKLAGRTFSLVVKKDGFYVGKTRYNSPTHAAREITQRPTSGTQFWGLTK